MLIWKNVNPISVVLAVIHDAAFHKNSMKECKADILRYRLPLKHPLLLKQFSLNEREGLILRLNEGGRFGYGEIAPLPGFSCESLFAAEKQLQEFCLAVNDGRFQPFPTDDSINRAAYQAVFTSLPMPSVSFGIESALWWLRQDDWLFPPVTAPLLQGATGHILLRLEQWQGSWPKEFKLKIGRDSIEKDCVRINKVLEALPESVSIKLDANQQWTLDQALRVARSIDVNRIAFVEEPTASVDDFSELYEKTGLHFALDETVQQPGYLLQPMHGLAAIVIKPSLVGGLCRCQQLVTAARARGIRVIFSSSYESSIGLHILEQLSAQWTPEELPGLDTSSAFVDRLVCEDIIAGHPVSINPAFVSLGEKS